MTTERVGRLLAVLPDGASEIYFHPATWHAEVGHAEVEHDKVGHNEVGRDTTLRRLMPDYEQEAELAALLACREVPARS